MGVFAVIGLGSFGTHLTEALAAEGHQVVVIDIDKEKIQAMKDIATQAILSDAGDKNTLKAIGIKDVDAVIISLNQDSFDTTVLLTQFLKEEGVNKILVKVNSEDEAKVVTKIGADQVIFPEKQVAIRLAKRLGNPNVIDQIDLGEDLEILEVNAPTSFHNKTIGELNLRKKYRIQIIFIKREIGEGEEKKIRTVLATPEEIILSGDTLTIVGAKKDVEKIKSLK
ncbi:MAG: TrkA family potassium uptake protein [Acidobacteria bacterium]|nr:TrkA family potassium uptake protein [Acidobacteriota bacterium]